MKNVWTFLRIIGWFIAALLLLALIQGISEKNAGSIAIAVFGFLYLLYRLNRKTEVLERRVVRLEAELGKHQRFHGHLTEFKE